MNEDEIQKLNEILLNNDKDPVHLHWWIRDACKAYPNNENMIETILCDALIKNKCIERVRFSYAYISSEQLEFFANTSLQLPNDDQSSDVWNGLEWLLLHGKDGHDNIDWRKMFTKFVNGNVDWNDELKHKIVDRMLIELRKHRTLSNENKNMQSAWIQYHQDRQEENQLHKHILEELSGVDLIQYSRLTHDLTNPYMFLAWNYCEQDHLSKIIERWLKNELLQIQPHAMPKGTSNSKEYADALKLALMRQETPTNTLDMLGYLIIVAMYKNDIEEPSSLLLEYDKEGSPYRKFMHDLILRLENIKALLPTEERSRRRKSNTWIQLIETDQEIQNSPCINELTL